MLGHSNVNIGDFNSFGFFWDTLYIESQILLADKSCEGDQIFQLKQNLLNEVEQREKLENDIAILVTGRNTKIEELNNTIASLQNKLELFDRENKSLREEIIRMNLINRTLETMKTVQPCDQITPEVEKSDINSTEGLQHTISSSYNNENTSITEIYQLCKDQLEGAGEFLHTVNTRERSGAFVPTDVVVCTEQNQPPKTSARPYSKTNETKNSRKTRNPTIGPKYNIPLLFGSKQWRIQGKSK